MLPKLQLQITIYFDFAFFHPPLIVGDILRISDPALFLRKTNTEAQLVANAQPNKTLSTSPAMGQKVAAEHMGQKLQRQGP